MLLRSRKGEDFHFVRNIYGDENYHYNARSVWQRDRQIRHGPVPFGPNVFSFDAERKRLMMPGIMGHWAVGAVVMQPNREIVAQFAGMVEIDPLDPDVNDFVRYEVIPHVDLPRYETEIDLLNAFWYFWEENGGSDRVDVIGDFRSPIEDTLFTAVQSLDLDNREFAGPNPLHEVATCLKNAGIDPHIDRIAFAGLDTHLQKHNPFHDAIASAHAWFNAREMIYNRRYFGKRCY